MNFNSNKKMIKIGVALLVCLLSFGIVGAVVNEHIAVPPVINDVAIQQFTGSIGMNLAGRFFNLPNNSVYNYSSTTQNLNTELRDASAYWQGSYVSLLFSVVDSGVYDIYTFRLAVDDNTTYETFLNGTSIYNGSVYNNSDVAFPLNDINNPLLLNRSETQNMTIKYPSIYGTNAKDSVKFVYKIWVVKRGNASVPQIDFVTYSNETLYHFNNTFLANFSGTMDIANVTANITCPNKNVSISFDKESGYSWKPEYKKLIKVNDTGKCVLNLTVVDSYGFSNSSIYEFWGIDATDVLVEYVYNLRNVVSGDTVNLSIQIINNGTLNATDYFLNITSSTLGAIYNDSFNISAEERRNISFVYTIPAGKSGKYDRLSVKIYNSSNSTSEVASNLSNQFKVAYSNWGLSNDMKTYITEFNVTEPNGTVVQNNITSNMDTDYVSIFGGSINSSYAVLKFKLNSTKASELKSQGKTLKVTKFNTSSNTWENVSVGTHGVTYLNVDLTNALITINTTSFSDWGFEIVNEGTESEPTPPSSSSGGGSSGGGGGGGGGSASLSSISAFRPFFLSDCVVFYGKRSREIDKTLAERVSKSLNCKKVAREDEEYSWRKYDLERYIVLIGGTYANEMVANLNVNLTNKFTKISAMTYHLTTPSFSIAYQGAFTIELVQNPYNPSKKVLVIAGVTAIGTEKATEIITSQSRYSTITKISYLGGY